MSQPAKYDSSHQRYYRQCYQPATGQWTTEWLPAGWSPEQEPTTPQSESRHFRSQSNSSLPPPFPPLINYGANAASSSNAGPPFSHSTAPSGYTEGPMSPPLTRIATDAYTPSGTFGNVPSLPRGKGTKIEGTYAGDGSVRYEFVDPAFFVRGKSFFSEGRVFAIIMSENAGEPRPSHHATDYNSAWSGTRNININPNITPVKYQNHLVHTQTRRFVVVRRKREFCYACPIFTYGGRATTKPGAKPAEHSIAYSMGQQQQLIPGESGITKASIGVDMVQGEAALDTASRIYFGIHHPIQYNVKVKDIGHVHKTHIHALIGNWNEENGKPGVGDNPSLGHLSEESDEDLPSSNPSGKAKRRTSSHKKSASNEDDPYAYNAETNPYGYHATFSQHVYHPTYNPHGYNYQYNVNGYHPTSNPHMFHPRSNSYGYHETHNPYGYHPTYAPFNWHPASNGYGYHKTQSPFCYHPQLNSNGYHPNQNPRGYHPQHNPQAYHSEYNPNGYK
ncbi:hypothetical protein FB567DRAFT_275191 [Paraphoma chrysanthemicola]|uniref:DUF6590 domain-containing protein n=1 Tax=Paraphoma chrysanthemicola TaxID=798071 RepID=A0A8K0RFF0_9PLEO|nr:hypothetical protein FB567DRAFT_275191 [Paraphoma chrysanthemicola]